MLEDSARAIEPQLKIAESNGWGYKRLLIQNANESLVKGERADISIISDDSIDRDGEICLPSGCDTTAASRYCPLTLNHNYSIPPVGRVDWIKALPNAKKARMLKAKSSYPERPEDHVGPHTPSEIWSLVQGSFLKGKSIGFLPTKMAPPTQKQIDEFPHFAKAKNVISEYSLIELAVCTLPCNTNALLEQVAEKSLGNIDFEWLQKYLNLESEDGELIMYPESWGQKSVWVFEDEPAAPEIPMPTFSKAVVDWNKIVGNL